MSEWRKAETPGFRRLETALGFLHDSGLRAHDLAQTAPRTEVPVPERGRGRTLRMPPPAAMSASPSYVEVLQRRRSRWPEPGGPEADVAGILAQVFGTASVGPADGHHHRSYPSASRAYAVHAYVHAPRIAADVIGRYDPRGHELCEVRPASIAELDLLTPQTRFGYHSFAEAAAVVFLVGDVGAMHGRYGALAVRLLLLEAGHIGGMLQLACETAGAAAMPFGGFYDVLVHRALDLDDGQHCLYVWAIG